MSTKDLTDGVSLRGLPKLRRRPFGALILLGAIGGATAATIWDVATRQVFGIDLEQELGVSKEALQAHNKIPDEVRSPSDSWLMISLSDVPVKCFVK